MRRRGDGWRTALRELDGVTVSEGMVREDALVDLAAERAD
jgi:hypothetical protein